MTPTPSPLAPTTLVERLRDDIAQLEKMVEQAAFAGPETGVRVKSPDILLADLGDALSALSASPAPQAGPASGVVAKHIENTEYICGQWEKNQGASSLTISVRCLLAALASAQRVDAPLAANPARGVTNAMVERLRTTLAEVGGIHIARSLVRQAIEAAAIGQAVDAPAVNEPFAGAKAVVREARAAAEDKFPALEAALAPAPSQPVADDGVPLSVKIGAEVRRRNRVGADDEKGSISASCEMAATELVLAALHTCGYVVLHASPSQPDGEIERLRQVVSKVCAALQNGAFCDPTCSLEFMEHVPDEVAGVVSGLKSRAEDLSAALDRLVNAKALAGVREIVAGWNGEGKPDGPYERHPSRLGATLPKTNCGAVYELDEAMQAARSLLGEKGRG